METEQFILMVVFAILTSISMGLVYYFMSKKPIKENE
jgi:hypothetical protein